MWINVGLTMVNDKAPATSGDVRTPLGVGTTNAAFLMKRAARQSGAVDADRVA